MPIFLPVIVFAGFLTLIPYLLAAFFPDHVSGYARRFPAWAQLSAPALLVIPYLLIAQTVGDFHWYWCALYTLLPPALAFIVNLAPDNDRTIWPQLLILAALGLSVDLRWFEPAWPPHLAVFNKILLLDAGIYAFVALHPIAGTGFDLRLRLRDLRTGLREFLFYLPIALTLGLALGFLHLHPLDTHIGQLLGRFALAWLFTFFFIAVPEELFFRGWMQNLFERRMGRAGALLLASALFGLSHFNKRTAFFNWRYVLLAAIAGIFYGRAWRRDRRVGSSAVTHATVDAVWSLFLR
ncbi:CPBP family intramembrane metalloprotease [Acidobacteria bacterium AB60]|nr:CPBP family intramembrane metalloprotease [Acidobacteria bacterium AB60]